MNKLNDTSPEADQALTNIYRKMTVAQKWHRLGEAYRTAKVLHATGVRLHRPAATAQEIQQDWVAVTLGESLLRTIREGRRGTGR
jgi:hypothetical protein